MWYLIQDAETDEELGSAHETVGAALMAAARCDRTRLRIIAADTTATVAIFERDDDGVQLLLAGITDTLYQATARGIRVSPSAWPPDW